MPELPEVETIRNDLAPELVQQTIKRVEVLFADPHYQNLEEASGRTIHSLTRRGKYLIAHLGDRELLIHLGMTGQVGVQQEVPRDLRHVHVRFWLGNGNVFYFNDQRRFGRLIVVRPGDYAALPTLAAMGPEPLSDDFDLHDFTSKVARVKTIKALLLSQQAVAGIGNIYADEALFLARIHPQQGQLTAIEAKRLHEAIRQVLSHGVENRGTTFKDYRDGNGKYGNNQDFLNVFDRTGAPCPRCKTPIQKLRVAGRGAHLCPNCQILHE